MTTNGDYRGEGEGTDVSPELRRRLETYATEVLAPSPACVERIRATVMAEARATLVSEAATPATAVFAASSAPASRPRRLSLRFQSPFRPFGLRPGLAFAAAGLALLVVAGGALAGSAPGGPLYGARLWLEEASLPATGQARLDAEERLLQERLDEAAKATAEGNGPAVQAALDAYRAKLADVVAAAGGDLTKDQHVALMLARHQAVLEALVTQFEGSPGKAATAIQGAIDRTQAKIDELNAESQGSGNGQGQGNGQQPVPSPKATQVPTEKPQHTPPARATEKPQQTPPPHESPPAHPTPSPAGGGPGSGGHGGGNSGQGSPNP